MDARAATLLARTATTPASTSHSTRFDPEELLRALDAYEDLPLDLLLDGSVDVEFAPLDSPPSSPLVGSEDSESACSSVTATPVSAVVPPTHKPASQRQKAERVFLRDQIVLLERELAAVKATRSFPSAPPAAWRAVAKRQRARRTAAESENERLRAKLQRQLQVAKSLEIVLRRRASSEQIWISCDRSPGNKTDAWMDDLGQVLRRFVMEIERAYEATNAVLPLMATARLADDESLTRSVVKAHLMDNGHEQLYVETNQAFVVPFAFDRVAAIAWPAFTSQFARQQRQRELYCSTDDLFACQFGRDARIERRAGRDPDGASTTVTATTIARRYYRSPDHTTVIVWRAFIAPADATLRDAVAVTTGWIRFQPLDGDPQCTVAHVCIRTVPKRCDLLTLARQCLVRLPETATSETGGTFLSQKLCTTAEDMMAVIEEIENLVLDEMATSSERSGSV